MRSWRWQRGELQPGCIVGVIIILLVAVVAIKAIPAMMRVYEFQDEIIRLADRANRRDYPVKRIHDMLVEKAADLRLPVGPEEIKITKTTKVIEVHIEYDYEIHFPGYTYVWHKVHHEERPLF
jgi:hypothetical protein